MKHKPWSPTRARKSGRMTDYRLMLECLTKATDLQLDPDNRALWRDRASYFYRCFTRPTRRAYVYRNGANWYCNECGKRHPCTKMVLEHRATYAPHTLCVPCADRLGIVYYTPATYQTGDFYRFAYSL